MAQPADFRKHGTATLGILLASIFLIACAEELWSRFIPDYLRALGATVVIVAVYGTLKDFLDAIYQFPGGLLTHRLGYRRALLLFNALAIIGYVAFASARSWTIVIAALPLVMAWQRFSLPATFSLIGDTLPHGRRSMAFAYQSIVRRIPIVVAPIAGGSIITHFGIVSRMRIAIVGGVILAIVALILQHARYTDAPRTATPLSMGTLLQRCSEVRETFEEPAALRHLCPLRTRHR